jgi:hypothetical protein
MYISYLVHKQLTIGVWFSPGTPVSSTNKSDRHDITEILLKVVLNTITKNLIINSCQDFFLEKNAHAEIDIVR